MTKRIETGSDVLFILQKLNVTIKQYQLCGQCRGCTRKLNDGYLVLVQEGLSYDAMFRTVQHELYHILLNHLDDDTKSIEEKEREVCRITGEYMA